jgi:hypothetical protein
MAEAIPRTEMEAIGELASGVITGAARAVSFAALTIRRAVGP